MSDDEEVNGHGREPGNNAAPEGNDYGKGNSGGGAPSGPANGAWRHGLYSRWMSEEDEELMLELDGKDGAEKLELIIDHMIARYIRACKELNQPEMISVVTEDGQEHNDLDMGDGPLAERADKIRKLIADYNKMTEGEKYQLEGEVTHTHETDLTEEEREQLDQLF
ncbi:hypothetical protein [Natrarchaeobaculum sulfurireducens]|uniref:Uncharacterized protein n=1 Tax=Natrarchaeobaculum sulfurireducens TaxID=2044521 RepID=A0A346PPR5_9EURY|nr:hypothetical protein [Natrarchaeobaculum sulfurireducens]AXR81510.1 hypothetical protein AArcMg_1497 [Natrarchaeobaculum sulfurireducens]